MDFNDLILRIKLLYEATGAYINFNKVKPPVVKEETSVDLNGNKTLTVTIGGGDISDEEILRGHIEINKIIDNIANLKDNLKKSIELSGKPKKIVEDEINSSLHLCLITDLDNQIKHGYPLNRKRSNKDPQIKNIRHEMMLPSGIGWSNMMSDSRTVLEADITDSLGEFICSFRELIENALTKWEDFIILNLPNKSSDIIAKRERKKAEENEFQELTKLEKVVNEIVSNDDNWIEIDFGKVNFGMFLRVFKKDYKTKIFEGISLSDLIQEEEDDYIIVKNVFLTKFSRKLKLKEYKWKILMPQKQKELEQVNDFYLRLENKNAQQQHL